MKRANCNAWRGVWVGYLIFVVVLGLWIAFWLMLGVVGVHFVMKYW